MPSQTLSTLPRGVCHSPYICIRLLLTTKAQAVHASTDPVSSVQLAETCAKRPGAPPSKVAKRAPLYRRNTKPRSVARSTRHNEVYPRGRHGFFVNEQAKVLSFLHQRLSQTNQGALKYFAQNLIAAICPRKRNRYPYRHGKAPPYWPNFGNYEDGPHHQGRPGTSCDALPSARSLTHDRLGAVDGLPHATLLDCR